MGPNYTLSFPFFLITWSNYKSGAFILSVYTSIFHPFKFLSSPLIFTVSFMKFSFFIYLYYRLAFVLKQALRWTWKAWIHPSLITTNSGNLHTIKTELLYYFSPYFHMFYICTLLLIFLSTIFNLQYQILLVRFIYF